MIWQTRSFDKMQALFMKGEKSVWYITDKNGNRKEAFRSRHEAFAHLPEYGDGYDVQEMASCALQEVRQAKGLSQPQLAEKSGVPVRTIRAIECGYRPMTNNRVGTAQALAIALDCSIEDLI